MLTDAKIRAAKAAGKRYELVDGDGLYLDVTAAGVKTWRYRYRIFGQREKVTIGQYPAVGLAEARARHLEMAAMVARDRSPAREIEQELIQTKQAGTVAELSALYRADLATRSKDGGEGSSWQFTAHIEPKLGRLRLGDVTPQVVLDFADKIKKGSKKAAPVSAIAVLGTLRRMFDFAVGRQLMASNPAAAIPSRVIGEKRPRERHLSPAEIGTMLRALQTAKGEPSTLLSFRLLLLTMVRRSELLEATWREFDLESATWIIPAERSKNGKAHVVPLSIQVLEILQQIADQRGKVGLVLSGRQANHPISSGTLHESMKRNEGFGIAPFTPHDFRRTSSTILHEQGWNTDVIEKALNHTMKGVRGVYNKAEYLEQRREMLQAWANYIDGLEAGADIRPIGSTHRTAA
jgi:integrase